MGKVRLGLVRSFFDISFHCFDFNEQGFDIQGVGFLVITFFNQNKTRTCPIPIWTLLGLRLALS